MAGSARQPDERPAKGATAPAEGFRRGGTVAPWAWTIGVVCIVVALTAATGLVVQHLTGHALPGCRAGAPAGASSTGSMLQAAAAEPSACASLEAHPAGSLGGMWAYIKARQAGLPLDKITPERAYWPVSYLGAAYFAALLAAWIVILMRGWRVGWALHWSVRFGAVISIAYLVVIFASSKICVYCLTTHAANLLLVSALEVGMLWNRNMMRRSGEKRSAWGNGGWSAVVAAAGVFMLSSGAMGMLDAQKRDDDAKKAHAEADKATEALRLKAEADRKAADKPVTEIKAPWGDKGFVGRWVYGPKQAQVRVVIYSSYQCPYCKVIEEEMFSLIEKHKDKISLSHMHFPMSSVCNKYANTDMHPNSCYGVFVAEAAALISGSKATLSGEDPAKAANDAFWKMHKWLFSRGGAFTNDELSAALPGLGYPDVAEFVKVMMSEGPKRGLNADLEIADAIGLQEVPMIYVNGVELRGWQQPGAVTRTIEAALAANPPALGHEADRPMLAKEKYVEDWRQERVYNIPQIADRTMGPDDAKVSIVVYGDYSEPNTGKVHAKIKEIMQNKSVKYSFRHFPGGMSCNPALAPLGRDLFPNGCLAAQAAEAAGIAGGADAFWKMSDWLFDNAAGLSPSRAAAGAASIGVDSSKFAAAIAPGGPASVNIQNQVMYAQSINVDRMPKIYVNGRWVRQWISEDQKDVVLERIVDTALKADDKGK